MKKLRLVILLEHADYERELVFLRPECENVEKDLISLGSFIMTESKEISRVLTIKGNVEPDFKKHQNN